MADNDERGTLHVLCRDRAAVSACRKRRNCLLLGLWLVLFTAFVPAGTVQAEDISITLSVEARDDQVTVALQNTGRHKTGDVSVELELDGRTYRQELAKILAPGSTTEATIQIELPTRPGSYPLMTTAFYLNEGEKLSVVDVGYFNFQRTVILPDECSLKNIRMTKHADLSLRFDPARSQRLHFPREIEVTRTSSGPGAAVYRLSNRYSSFNTNSAIFSILENSPDEPEKATKICEARLIATAVFARDSVFETWAIAVIALLGFLATGLQIRRFSSGEVDELRIARTRYTFSIFVVGTLFFAFRTLHHLPDLLLPILYTHAPGNPVVEYFWLGATTLLRWLYFQGGDYDYFFHYLADPLFFYILTLNLPVLYYLVRPDRATEKYWHLMLTVFSLPVVRLLPGSAGLASAGCSSSTGSFRPHWTRQSRLAILSLMVKTFYLPVLTSWSINNVIHVTALAQQSSWNFATINKFAVEVLILVDVTIFALGYLTELPQLNNRIRSVEPTIFGWFICIICYPPFNKFVFVPIDQPLHEYWTPSYGAVNGGALFATSILWFIYVWASWALGFRASNLTNRGIVDSGPYAFIRHPAYVSKVLVWTIASFYLSTMNFFLVLTLAVVYTLRAWTEERHLSADPDYLAYKKKVPWTVFPGVV